MIVLLSELYNFQVISSPLVFDVIRGLLESGLSEFCMELLLKIVRSKHYNCPVASLIDVWLDSGQQLRQDDPSALKDIIQIVQAKVSEDDVLRCVTPRLCFDCLTFVRQQLEDEVHDRDSDQPQKQ